MTTPTGMRFVTVNIFWKNNYLVCLRGKRDKGYKKIYAVGGKIDPGETPEQTAVRETFEEAGVVIRESDLRVFHIDNKIGMTHYTVVFDKEPVVLGPREDFMDEIYDTSIIMDTPTIKTNGVNTRWAFVNVYALKNFLKDPKNRSFATKTFRDIYTYVFSRT